MKKQICRNCLHFSVYYKRWGDRFSRLPTGFCCKHDKQQAHLEACENYLENKSKEEQSDLLLFQSLKQALKSVNQIAQILKENQEDL